MVCVDPEVLGEMYKLFSFKKHSGTTGQPLPRRAISYQEFSVIHVSKLKGTLD